MASNNVLFSLRNYPVIGVFVLLLEIAKDDQVQLLSVVRVQEFPHSAAGNVRGMATRVAIYAGRDSREGDRVQIAVHG